MSAKISQQGKKKFIEEISEGDKKKEHKRWKNELDKIKLDNPEAAADKQLEETDFRSHPRRRVELEENQANNKADLNSRAKFDASPISRHLEWKILRSAYRNSPLVQFYEFFIAFLRRIGLPVRQSVNRIYLHSLIMGSERNAPLLEVLNKILHSAKVLQGTASGAQVFKEVRKIMSERGDIYAFLWFLIEGINRKYLFQRLDELRRSYLSGKVISFKDLEGICLEIWKVCFLIEKIDDESLEHILKISRKVHSVILEKFFPSATIVSTTDERLKKAGHVLNHYLRELIKIKEDMRPLMNWISGCDPEINNYEDQNYQAYQVLDLKQRSKYAINIQAEELNIKEILQQEEEGRKGEEQKLESEMQKQMADYFKEFIRKLKTIFPGIPFQKWLDGSDYFFLPVFDKIYQDIDSFTKRPPEDVQILSINDPLKDFPVFYRLIDDCLSILDSRSFDKIASQYSSSEDSKTAFFSDFKAKWEQVNELFFYKYLRHVYEFAMEREAASSAGISSLVQKKAGKINAMRNFYLKHHAYQLLPGENFSSEKLPPLFQVAADLARHLSEMTDFINFEDLSNSDAISRKKLESLAVNPLFSFREDICKPKSPNYKPFPALARKNYLKRRFRITEGDAARFTKVYRQIEMLDLFKGLTELFSYLLNDPASPYLSYIKNYSIEYAGELEQSLWKRTIQYSAETTALSDDKLPLLPEQQDPLTGLANRRYYDQISASIKKKLENTSAVYSVIELDIDHFKWINDNFGHDRGDEILKFTTKLFKENIRPQDFLFRMGGEEFTVLLEEDYPGALDLARRIGKAQEKEVLSNNFFSDILALWRSGEEPCATLSIGVAPILEDIDTARSQADKALYAAKKKRNTVMGYPEMELENKNPA